MSYKAEITEMRTELKQLYKAIPGATKGFAELSKAAKEEGVLEHKHREYVAVGIAVAQRCQPCINFHVEALMKAGGTRQELSDRIEAEWPSDLNHSFEAKPKLDWTVVGIVLASATISGFAMVELWHLIAAAYDLVVRHA